MHRLPVRVGDVAFRRPSVGQGTPLDFPVGIYLYLSNDFPVTTMFLATEPVYRQSCMNLVSHVSVVLEGKYESVAEPAAR